MPVFEGHSIPHAIKKNNIAGRAITDKMVNLLILDDIKPEAAESSWQQIIGTMKEKVCTISMDYDSDKDKAAKSDALKKEYVLPDGKKVFINTPRFEAPEALFNPEII